MSNTRRKNAYRSLKAVLSDMPIPASHAAEIALNWQLQEHLNEIMEATSKSGMPNEK